MIRHNILANGQARQGFIDGCLALKAEPLNQSSSVSTYDYFAWWHQRAMNRFTPNDASNPWLRNAAHGGPSFGPWHRLFLLVFEFEMRRVLQDDDFRIPYWNWGVDALAPFDSALWELEVMGGDGDPVTTGPFRAGNGFDVRLTDDSSGNSFMFVNRPLRRNMGALTRSLSTNTTIRNLIRNDPLWSTWPWDNSPSTGGFRRELEMPLHNTIHRFVGGDMMTSTSPNDPVFWLHHSNIDRIWSAWQDLHGVNNYVPPDSESNDLEMHRLNDRLHSFLSQGISTAMVLAHRPYYQYDTVSDIAP